MYMQYVVSIISYTLGPDELESSSDSFSFTIPFALSCSS